MKIIKQDKRTGWVTAIIEGRWVQTRVFDEASFYGINEGRVSKLWISKTSSIKKGQNFEAQMDFAYDRGEYINRAPADLVSKIISKLETLPTSI
jgi:hypothetical protein